MSSLVGRMQEFQPESEQISAYLERLEMYFLANGVADDKRVPVLLSVIGKHTYSLLRNLVAPGVPKDESFAALLAALTSHYEPKPITIAERHRFYNRQQKEGETMAEFLAELRRLSVT